MSSGKHESLFLTVKETAKTDLYETDLPEFDTSHNEKVYMYIITHMTNNILSSIFSHPLHQESDQILKPSSIYEVARFFSLYDLQVTERQKIQFLSLAATSSKNYLLDYELYSILIVYRPSISN